MAVSIQEKRRSGSKRVVFLEGALAVLNCAGVERVAQARGLILAQR